MLLQNELLLELGVEVFIQQTIDIY